MNADPDGYPVIASVRAVITNCGPRDGARQPSKLLHSFNLASVRIDLLVTLGGGLGSVRLRTHELIGYNEFRERCLDQLRHLFPADMPRKAWLERVAKALEPFRG